MSVPRSIGSVNRAESDRLVTVPGNKPGSNHVITLPEGDWEESRDVACELGQCVGHEEKYLLDNVRWLEAPVVDKRPSQVLKKDRDAIVVQDRNVSPIGLALTIEASD